MNPEDAAAARFKEIWRAREQTRKAEQAHAAARAQLEELQQQLGPAELRDRERLGDALIAGKSEPDNKADAIRTEITRQQQRVEALRLATDRAYRAIPKLVDANREGWRRQAMRDHEQATGRYQAAISELQAAREALVDTATLVHWLDSGDIGEATTGLPVDRMLAELRNDAGVLAAHPDTPRGGPQPEPRFELATGASITSGGWGGE